MGQICSQSPLLCVFSQQLYSDSWWIPSLSLPALGGLPNTITTNGISGGSSTSMQMHTIYSEDIVGAGLIVGSPYSDKETKIGLNLAQQGIEFAETFASQGLIDDTSNLKDDPVWIFSGNQDPYNPLPNQLGQKDFYEHFGAKPKLIQYDIGHNFPTIFAENSDFIVNDGYDTVGIMFEYILTNLKENALEQLQPPDFDFQKKGILRRFDQRDFIEDYIFDTVGLADYGYVYYPYQCVDGSVQNCRVHMVLPGCAETQVLGGYAQFNVNGYGQYAASNDMIILYPLQKWDWYNLQTCMDFQGYSTWFNNLYLTNKGPQMQALKNMLDRVVSPRDESKWNYLDEGANIYADFSISENLLWNPYLFFANAWEWVMTITWLLFMVPYTLLFK